VRTRACVCSRRVGRLLLLAEKTQIVSAGAPRGVLPIDAHVSAEWPNLFLTVTSASRDVMRAADIRQFLENLLAAFLFAPKLMPL